MSTIVERASFLKSALHDRKIGAVTMSSGYVVADVLRRLPKDPRLVVEYGPGSGVVTREILRVLPQNARLIVVEPNQGFLETLKEIADLRLTIIPGMAQGLPQGELDKMRGADAVVASIPFSLLTLPERSKIVSDAYDILSPGGSFIISHQYTWIMRGLLKRRFPQVSISFEPRNIFPCFIITAKRS